MNQQQYPPLHLTSTSPKSGEITVSLLWNPDKYGFLKLFRHNIDLDLGCYIRLVDSRSMLIDGLQFANVNQGSREELSRQGCYTSPPFTWHHGDDRDGTNTTGETISINPAGINEIEEITIYAFIYSGVSSWAHTDARIVIHVPGNADATFDLSHNKSHHPFCAICKLHFDNQRKLMTIEPIMQNYDGHQDCSHAMGWSFKFEAGSK